MRKAMEFDAEVKLKIYEMTARNASIPNVAEVATELGVPQELILDSIERLSAKRLLVPEPGDSSRIRMAPPFSGIKTAFQVEVGDRSYYANCVWDAFGIPAALQMDGIIYAVDGFTEEPLQLEISGGRPRTLEYVAHFAVPAALWWDDIVYT
jgi:hypothetical protein